MGATLLACAAAGLATIVVPADARAADEPGEALGSVINQAIHDGGPLFTPAERALIERKCGYAPGEWDGRSFSVDDGVFHCRNGKMVDDPEMRAMLAVAQPRIGARISAAMARPEVQAAIRRVADEAVQKALANLGTHSGDRE